MCGACSIYGVGEKFIELWLENQKGRDHSEDIDLDRWEDNIRMDLGKIEWEVVE
jgi:hypothetical protein